MTQVAQLESDVKPAIQLAARRAGSVETTGAPMHEREDAIAEDPRDEHEQPRLHRPLLFLVALQDVEQERRRLLQAVVLHEDVGDDAVVDGDALGRKGGRRG